MGWQIILLKELRFSGLALTGNLVPLAASSISHQAIVQNHMYTFNVLFIYERNSTSLFT